ncbi:predicted protein [Arabidopsis lyrata subsp. lyrata]|uniref:Predicted protein n=1 Tax=Arabidopsis lyrata subsp. lyrata TaxID=81972 RepID=D7LJB1_ARALL|nr:predicted protein [Arabidopsis lyrata subsp. lyrata]
MDNENSGDKDTRVNLMSFHILNWASSSFKRQPNVMLISRNLPDDTEFVRVFNALKSRGFNVLLVQPHDEAASKELLRNADSISDSTRFFNGGNPLDDQSGSSQGSLVSNSLAIETINNEDFSSLYSRGYNAFLVQPNLLAPEMSQTSEWPGCVLDVGKVTGRFLLAPSQMKRMRKKVKPRRIRQGRRALRED